MSREIMNGEVSNAIISIADQLKLAKIYEGTTQRPFEVQSVTLNLTNASTIQNPYRIGFQFRSIFVASASDAATSISLTPQTNDSFQSSIPLKLNDSWVVDYPVSQGFLTWAAQPGKSITVLFFVSSQFQSGSQLSIQGGTVSQYDGSSASLATTTLSAATAAIVAPALGTRKFCVVQNKTGAVLYVGANATVTNSGATEGINIPADGVLYWRNTAALYAYSVAGGKVQRMEEA